MYVVFETQLMPKKRQLPDVRYTYLVGSVHNPEYTTNLDHATIFYDEQEAKTVAKDLCMEVGQIVTKVKKVY